MKSEADKAKARGEGNFMQGVHATGQIVDKLTLGVGPKAKEGYDQRRNGARDMAHAAWGALGDVFGIKSNPKTDGPPPDAGKPPPKPFIGPVAKEFTDRAGTRTPSETVLRLDRSPRHALRKRIGERTRAKRTGTRPRQAAKGDGYHQVAQARVLGESLTLLRVQEEALKDPSYGKYMKDEIQSLKNHNNGAPSSQTKARITRLERRSSKSRTPRRNSPDGSEISARCTRARSPSPSRHRPGFERRTSSLYSS